MVESHGWLQQDKTDISNQLLAPISTQLASLSVSPEFINSTMPPAPPPDITSYPGPSVSSVRINVLWFLSISLSLVTSLLAIMMQQWLREYRVPEYFSSRERIRLRQLHYQALLDWWMHSIVSILPILLQIAPTLFLSGLCYLLSTLDQTVSKVLIYLSACRCPSISRSQSYPSSSDDVPTENLLPMAFWQHEN